jgi:hypothetical protein
MVSGEKMAPMDLLLYRAWGEVTLLGLGDRDNMLRRESRELSLSFSFSFPAKGEV